MPVDAGPVLNRDGEPIVTREIALASAPPRSLPKLEIKRPPAPKPKVEPTKAKPLKIEPAKVTKVEPPKPKEIVKKEPASQLYVQLASGAHADRMGTEFKRIKAKKPGLFAGRNARVTNGKDLFRLVIGPFKTREDSSDFVNQLSKAGINGFSYTAPDGMTFDKLPAK